MKFDLTFKVSDWIKIGGALLTLAVVWGSTRTDLQYLRRDVDANRAKTEQETERFRITTEKLSSGFADLAQAQAVLAAIVAEREKVKSRLMSPKEQENK